MLCRKCRKGKHTDPVVASLLPGLNLALAEPESNLLLGGLNGVGTVADVAANVL